MYRISALGGYLMEGPEGDWISTFLARGRPYEEDLLKLCRDLAQGGLFVDAGAHIGNHSIYMAKAGSPVVAFEPNPAVGGFLKRNVEANGLSDQVRIISKALWSGSGVGQVVDEVLGNSGQSRIDPGSGGSELMALDDLEIAPAVIKIDVEGLELAVLLGATRTLNRSKPALLVEALNGDREVRRFLTPLGYRRIGPSFAASPTYLFVARPEHRTSARPHATRQRWMRLAKGTWRTFLKVPGARRLRGMFR
jgi:FkbM family methyltransferase